MKLDDGRIQVEQLDDTRLANIERRVVAGASEPTARMRRVGLDGLRGVAAAALVMVAVIGAGLGGWLLRARSGRDAASGAPVAAAASPLEITTGHEATRVSIGDATIESSPGTHVTVTRPDGMVLVALTHGRIELDVAKRAGRPPLVVRAGDTDVIVVGTHFTVVYRDGRGAVAVSVSEGVVRVVRRGAATAPVPVAAGQAWSTEQGLAAGAALPTIGDVAAARGPGDVAIAPGDQSDGLPDRVARIPEAAPTAGERPVRRAPASAAGEAVLRNQRDRAATAATAAPPTATDLPAMVARQRVEPALDVGTVDATHALAQYRALLTTEKGPRAAQAFYSMAVTQHLKLGRNRDALATLDALVRRFRDSDYHTAAAWLRVRISCTQQVDDRCRAAATAYLRRTRDGVAASVAESITAAP